MRKHVVRGGAALPAAAAALVAVAVLAGFAAADPAAAIVARPAGPPATTAELHGHEQFRLTTHSATSRSQRLRGSGVLNARGHALVGRVIEGKTRNWLVVPHGAIRLITLVTAISVTPPTAICRFTETYSGTYQIRGGARRYASARGYGTYGTKIVGRLGRKHGRCTSAIAYFSQSTVTSGSLRW